jgi:hypothetical protein
MLVAPGDAEAFRLLLAFSRTALAAEPSEVVLPAEPLVLHPLDIEPLAVSPLVVTAVIEGGPQ